MKVRSILRRAAPVLGAITGLWAGMARDAGAVSIDYAYQSTCLSNCDEIGIPVGGGVGGIIGFDSSVILPNGTIIVPLDLPPFFPGPVQSFDLTFGSQRVTGPGLPPFFSISGSAQLDASTSAATSFAFSFSGLPNPDRLISDTGWEVFVRFAPRNPVSGGPGTLTRLTPIGEPATILVLSAGLLGLFLRRASFQS